MEFEKQQYKGMLNIGFNPTFNKNKLSIELHILDFQNDIYDKTIKVFFEKKNRDEKKFSSVDELKIQLSKDQIIDILNEWDQHQTQRNKSLQSNT